MSRIREQVREEWLPHPDRTVRLDSATTIARWAATARLYERHRNELLSIACWKASELDGKWRTRYRTRGVVEGNVGVPINHEHVVPRLVLRQMMLRHPHSIGQILVMTVACLVTREEHAKLNQSSGFGWERYLNSSLDVLDMADRSTLDLTQAGAELKLAFAPFIE